MANVWKTGEWELIDDLAPFLKRVLLYGPPGTGKSRAAMKAGVPRGKTVYRINMTEETPAAELRGHWVPKGMNFEWHDGPAMLAYRNGGRLVIDEITRAADDALSFLLAILDDPDASRITLPTGEHVLPHKDFTVWATTNDTVARLTDALADRFVVRIECRTAHPDALKRLSKPLAKLVVAQLTGQPGSSLRQALEYTRLIDAGVNPELAARAVWEENGKDKVTALQLAQAATAVPAPPKLNLDDFLVRSASLKLP